MKVVKCRIGRSYFGFNIMGVRAVSQTVIYKEYLGQNRYTLGYFIFRGDNFQLVDITKLLAGKYDTEYEKQIMVLLKNHDIGILVDELIGNYNIKDPDLEIPSESIKRSEFIKYLVTTENYPVYNIESIVKKVIGKRSKNVKKK
ncbi:chemotaxis protein CheW [bacterium]|nr:chemotaxis protein CheW [bacterium]